jgi:type VI secretion system protein ImpJ
LLDKLESKSQALSAERAGAGGDLADFAAREIAGFWLSHAVNSAIGPLRHHLNVGTSHPEELYLELARLAGSLCTFSLDADPRALPPYDHDDLEASFGPLELQIRRLLDVWFSNRVVTYPLEVTEPPVYAADITDPRCLNRTARWFLEVRSSAGQAQVASRVPELVKVCSADAVLKLVQRQLPGLTIDYLALPPAELSPRVGSHYFTLDTVGQGGKNPCMVLIQKTRRVGVFVPGAIPDARLALLILLEE